MSAAHLATREALAKVLEDAGVMRAQALHPQHLADVILASLADDEALVEAWEEGYEAGVSDTVARSAPPGPNGPIDPTANPYLAAALIKGGAA